MPWMQTLETAQAAIKAGNLDEADKLLDTVEREKRAEKLEAEAKAAQEEEIKAKRLPFGVPAEESAAETASDIATKSWYMRKFGDTGTAMDQVMTELYGQDHRKFSWAKSADFVRYIRSGHADPQLHRALVFSPTQVEGFLQLGMSVGELKATQVESQDQLGRLQPAA